MKQLGFTLALVYFAFTGLAQQPEIDSLKKIIANTNVDTVKIAALVRLAYYAPAQTAFSLDEEALQLSRKLDYQKGEAAALGQYCNDFLSTGNYVKALEYALQALQINEQLKNTKGIASNYFFIARVYLAEEDYQNARAYFYKALTMQSNRIDPNLRILYLFLGDVYDKMNQTDSALFYYQRSYEAFNTFKNKEQWASLLSRLGDVHTKLGNTQLAFAYYRMGIEKVIPGIGEAEFGSNYYGLARLFKNQNRDSAVFYAHKALASATYNPDMLIKSAQLLAELYEPSDPKAALYFYKIATSTKDSVYQAGKFLQIQNMSFNESERQKEKAAYKWPTRPPKWHACSL